MRFLTPEEQKQFRAESQQKEDEIQKNIALYLSALAVVTGWVFGPQARPLVQLFFGNEGMNIFGLLILLVLNIIFTCFLVYKNIQIHEIMQFVVFFSEADLGIRYWEAWRRSKQSLTKKATVRFHHMVAIGMIPFAVSVLTLIGTHQLIWQDPATLANEIVRAQAAEVRQAAGPASPQPLTAPPSLASTDLVDRVTKTLGIAQTWWWTVLCLHYIPALFLIVSWLVSDRKWKEITAVKTGLPDFNDLRALKSKLPVVVDQKQA